MAKKSSSVDKPIKAKGKSLRVSTSQPKIMTGASKTAHQTHSRRKKTQTIKEQLAQRNAELSILNSISQAMGQRLDMNGIIRIVGDKVRETFNAEVTEILMLDESTNMIHAKYSYYRGYQIFEPFPFGEGLTSRIMRTRTPITHHTLEEAVALGALFLSKEDETQSYVGVPILAGDKALGVISVQSYQPHVFDENHVRLLSTLAANMGVALEYARLFDESQRLLEETGKAKESAETLRAANQVLTQNLNLEAICEKLLNLVYQIAAYDSASIFLLESNSRLVAQATRGYDLWLTDPMPAQTAAFDLLPGSTMYHLVQTRDSYLIPDTRQDPDWVEIPGEGYILCWLGVPMLVGDKVIGVISLDSTHPGFFTEEHIQLATALGAQAAFAIANARLFDETQRGASEMAALTEIGREITATLDLPTVLRRIAERAMDVLNARDVVLRLLEPDGRLPATVALGPSAETYKAWESRLGQGLTGRIAQSGIAEIVNDPQHDPRFARIAGTAGEENGSVLFAPLLTGEVVIGILVVWRDRQAYHSFVPSDLDFAVGLARQAAIAIQNARLFDETQRLLKETEQRNAELAVINSVQVALAVEINLQGIYEIVGEKIREIFDKKDVSIRIYDPQMEMEHFPYSVENGKRIAIDSEPVSDKGFGMYVYRTRKTLVINQNMAQEKENYGSYTIPGTVSSKSLIMVPLVAGEQIRGLIEIVDVDHEHAFSDSDVRLLQTLANAIGIALENARLFDETQRLLKETEQRNTELAIINSIGQILTEESDLSTMVERVGEKLHEALQVKNIAIGIYNDKENIMQVPYTRREGRRLAIPPFPLNAFNRRVSKAGRSLVVSRDAPRIWTKLGGLSSGDEIPRSFVLVPMAAGRELVGGITLQDFADGNAFAGLSVGMLETIASNMGTAILNARLFDETQRLLKVTVQRAAELTILNDVGETVASTLDVKGMARKVGDKVREIFAAEIAHILLYDPASNMVHVVYSYGNGYFDDEPPWPLDAGGLSSRIIRSRQPLLLNSVQEMEAYGAAVYLTIPSSEPDPQSYLGVPIMVGDRVLGVLDVQSLRPNGFDESNLSLLQTLASNMGVALENARLFDETGRRSVELAAISKVSQSLVAETELDGIIQLIGSQIREIFDADIVYIALLDPQTDLIHFPYQVGESFTTLRLGEGHTSRIIQTGEPLLMNRDIEQRSRELGVTRLGRESLSYLGVPIKSGGETIGVISVQSTTREGVFTEDSLRLLGTIAANAGAAIHTARLHGETQRNASQMATIANVGRELSATLDLQKVIQTVVENIHNLFQASDTVLRLIHPDGGFLHTALAIGSYAREHTADIILLGEGITGYVAQSGIAEMIENVDLDPRGIHIEGTPDRDEIPQTLMVAPLIAGNRTIGVISVYRDRPVGSFSQDDLDFLLGLGRQAALAIQNATLFRNQRIAREQAETLQAVTQALSRTLSLQEVFDLILAELHRVVPYNSCSVQEWDGEYSVIVGGRGFPNLSELLGLRFPTVEGDLSSYVLKGRQPHIVEDVSESYPYFKNPEFGGGIIHGWMGVPLIYGDRAIGMLTLDKHEKAFYTQEHAQLAMAFAAQAAVAIENARLFETEHVARRQAEIQSRQMATIASVGRDLSATLDLQKVIYTVVENVHNLFQARDTILRLVDSDGTSLRTVLAIGNFAEQFTSDVIALGEGITGGIAQSGIAEVIDDVERDPRRIRILGTPVHFKNPQTMMVAPLIARERTIGVLTVYRDRTEGSFSQVDLDFLVGLGRQAAIAIENSRLFDETQRLLKQTEQRATELQIIDNIGQIMTEGLDLSSAIKRVGDRLREVLNLENIAITISDKHMEYVIDQYFHSNRETFDADHFSLEKYKLSMRLSMRGGGRSWVVNENAEKSWRRFASTLDPSDTPKSFILLPLMAGKIPIGGITIANYEREHAFANISISMLETIASNMGTAIQNVRLFEETQRLLKETEQRNAELAVITSIQTALASKMDFQAIIDVVGDKLSEIFEDGNVGIALVDDKRNVGVLPYVVENGKRLEYLEVGLDVPSLLVHTIKRRRPLLINKNISKRFGTEVFNFPGLDQRDLKSWLSVPLISADKFLGGIALRNWQRENAYSESDMRLLQAIANSMSVALENARLFDETQRLLKETNKRTTELQIINNIGQTLTEGLDLQSTIEHVGERLQDILKVQSIAIAVSTPAVDSILAQYIYHNGQQIEPNEDTAENFKFGIRFAARWAGKSWVASTSEKYLEKYIRKFAILGLPKSFAAFPLLSGGEVIGGITIADDERDDAFNDLPIDMLETISSNMGTAIQNVRLFDETQRLLKETEQRAAELQIINNIGQTLTESGNLEGMIPRVGERIQEALNLNNIAISIFDEETEHVIAPYMVRNGQQITITEENFDLNRYKTMIRASARRGGVSWIVKDAEVEKVWRRSWRGPIAEDVPRSIVVLPLMAGGEIVGGISLADYQNDNAFTKLSVNLLETIASNMGTAVQNVRLFDETQRLFAEAEESRAAAEQANKAKSTFLANMSHELRTPLNAIIGFTRIVRKKGEDALPAKQIENLDKVLSSSQHLLSLINTVLDIAKIEAGRLDVIPARFNMSVLADQCANLAIPLLKPTVTLEKQVDETIGLIFTDQDKIKQIVINLLSNAAKFTHEGRILLSVQKLNDEFLDISVTDSGIGIKAEAIGRVFEEFQQADNTTTRQYGGTGLGLSISRHLARLLGGDLTATSEFGKGSTFTLTIPIYYGRKPASLPEQELHSAQETLSPSGGETGKHRILVIDDDPDALYLLQESLGAGEFEVIGSRSGQAGLQMAREQQPEAILLDILMPETDGWQTLNDLKSEPATVNIPVILLTIIDKKALGFKLGAAEYLLKPLNPGLVMDALRRVITGKGNTRKCVLVVDDDPHVAEMLRQSLPDAEFDLNSAEDGEAGVRAARELHPDVILLDLMMPGLDGFGVIERVRADTELQSIPIIVISAKELSRVEAKALQDSVTIVMKKQGFDASKLVQEINTAIGRQ